MHILTLFWLYVANILQIKSTSVRVINKDARKIVHQNATQMFRYDVENDIKYKIEKLNLSKEEKITAQISVFLAVVGSKVSGTKK